MRRFCLLGMLGMLAIASIASAIPVRVNNGMCAYQPGRELVALPTAVQQEYLAKLAATGWKILRTDFTWQLIEPAPGQFDFAAYDTLMANVAAAGLKVIGVLNYGNPWAAPGAPDDRTPPTDPATFATFAGTVAGRFKGKINVWEVWDEPNRADGSTWQPAPNPAQYAALFAATARAIRKADKRVTIITGGLAPGDQGGAAPPTDDAHRYWGFLSKAFGPKKKQRRLAKLGRGAGIHPAIQDGIAAPERAAAIDTPSLNEQLFRFLDRVRVSRLTRLELFITSMGWRTGPAALTEAEQAAYLVRAATLGLSQEAQRICWSRLTDSDDEGFGLYRREANGQLTPKLAVTAANHFVTRLTDSIFVADLGEELGLASGSYAMCFQSAKETTIVLWSLTEGRTATYGDFNNATAKVALYDLDGGDPIATPAKNADGKFDPQTITLGPSPVYLVHDGI
jgi:Cellulase (glycosyl hydrolase family 5)